MSEKKQTYYPIIIVEGMDNSGKDFVIDIINKLIREYNDEHKDWYNSILNIHCTKPLYNYSMTHDEYKQMYIKENSYLMKYALQSVQHNSCVILNRSYFSDYVYGQIYRNIDQGSEMQIQDSIFDSMVDSILFNPLLNPDTNYHYISVKPERKVIEQCLHDNILYIQLHTPLDFLITHDDGKSQSKNNKDLIIVEDLLYNENYKQQTYFSKYMLETTEMRIADQYGYEKLVWKGKERLAKELKKVIFR